MAYVRQRGNQVLIVHGERDRETKNVEQRVLFTIYSKPEALEILGRPDPTTAQRFQGLLERHHEGISFDWKAIRRGVADLLHVLPDTHDYRAPRLEAQFRSSLATFARQLMLADPQDLVPAAQLIRGHRYALEYLAELIGWRVKLCGEREPNQWNSDNGFFWRFALQGRHVPPDIEEHAADLYQKRDFDRAEAIFRLLLDAFDGYAEGHNYLGLIALERERHDEAIEHFKRTVEVGRTLFPKKIAKSRYWQELETRPYMRGLRNLALTYVRAGEYDEASRICDRLETECGDTDAVMIHRAEIAMNTGKWRVAADLADRLRAVYPMEAFTLAFAEFELGERAAARAAFLHAAFNAPCGARVLLGMKSSPKDAFEARNHNDGIAIANALDGYLRGKGRSALAHFRALFRDPRVAAVVKRVETLRGQWFGKPKTDRTIFDEFKAIESIAFATELAASLGGARSETPREKRAVVQSARLLVH